MSLCGLIQHSWWHKVLENADYRVVRVDTVNSVADVLTFEVSPETESRHPLFLTVAEIDWRALVVAVRVFEVVGLIAMVAVLWYLVIRPWPREGHVTFDGMLCGAIVLSHWRSSSPPRTGARTTKPLKSWAQTWSE